MPALARGRWARELLCLAGILISLLLVEANAAAQTRAGSAPAPVPEKDLCTVSGRVVNSETGEPVSRANLAFSPSGDSEGAYGAQTDAAGQFSIGGMIPGRYSVAIQRDGYTMQTHVGGIRLGDKTSFVLALGETSNNLVYHMAPWSVVSGRVTDGDGEPMPSARVQVLSSHFVRGRRRLQNLRDELTNDLGEYRAWGLQPGRYYVRATNSHGGGAVISGSAPEERDEETELAYVPVFYPGTPDASQAVTLDVRAGQEVAGIDLTLALTHAVSVRGRVFDGGRGQPAQCCLLFFAVDETGLTRYGGANRGLDPVKGTFELQNVIPGTYEVVAMNNADGRQYSARTRIEVGASDVEGVELTMTRGADLRGRFTVEGQATVDVTRLGLSLLSPERETGMQSGRMTEVRPDGSFAITGVPEETYEVLVTGRFSGTYVKSVRADGQDVLDTGMYVSPAGVKGAIEVVLSSAGALVDGVVTDENGQAVNGALVGLVPDGDKRRLYRLYTSANTDPSGRFVFRDVPPGDFSLFAWQGAPGEWQDPDFLRPVEAKGLKITAAENEHKTVQLEVIPAGGGTGQ